MKTYLEFNQVSHHDDVWGSEGQLQAFLTLVLDGDDWLALHPSHFTAGGKIPWYPLERRLGGPQSQSEHSGKSHL
jgi:hypothetical protein